MNVTVFSFSPKNETSITFQSALYLQKVFKDDCFDLRLVGGKCQCTDEDGAALENSELIMLITSLFHFSVPHQMMMFLDDLYNRFGSVMKQKTFVLYSTSGKIMDITMQGYVENFLNNHGLKYERPLSQFDVSILSEKGRTELIKWFRFIKDRVTGSDEQFKDNKCRAVVFDVSDGDDPRVSAAAEKAEKLLSEKGASVSRINIRDYKILGCTACYSCYTTCVCCLNKADDWARCFEDVMKDTDIVFYVGKLENGLIGHRHKAWLDRQVQFGRHPFYREKIFDFLLDTEGTTSNDMNMLKIHTAAMNGFGGDVTCCIGDVNEIEDHIRTSVLLYNNEITHSEDFYGVGVDLKFQRLATEIQNLAPSDYEYYKASGVYKPMEINPNITPVHSPEDAVRVKKGRLIPYKAVIMDAEGDVPDLSERVRNNGPMPQMEYIKPETKKFSLFGKKNK
ncbi:MAG: hypothetical protein ACI4KF_02190 [Huintestinicola sp.]